jgi:hypothetical protein
MMLNIIVAMKLCCCIRIASGDHNVMVCVGAACADRQLLLSFPATPLSGSVMSD